jgi:cell division protein FtsB
LDFQFNRKTARDLPRRPVSQRHGQRLNSRDLFSAEPSLSPQDGPKIVNTSPSARQKLGRAGANEFTAGSRGTGAASQVKYSSSTSSVNKADRKAATRAELLKRREALQQRLAAQKSGASTGSKIAGVAPTSTRATTTRPTASRTASSQVAARRAVSAARPTVTRNRATASRARTTTVRPKTKAALRREELLMKGLWIFFATLLVRLIFMDNGVIDYYKMETALEYKGEVYKNLVEENKSLVDEIKLINSNSAYQKKIVREHLGVIDRDEFLILFAGSKGSTTK